MVVLVSGGGSLLAALLAACSDPEYGADVVAVGSDRTGIGGLDVARQAEVPTFTHRVADYATRDDWDAAFADSVAAYRPDLVVSAGFMKLLGKGFLDRFPGIVINTHPALLPAFPGMHGPADAIEHGVKVAGCTLFLVDPGVDSGPIIAQRAVDVLDSDDAETLHERIKVAERALLVDVVGRMARNGWQISGRKVVIG